MKYDYIKNIKLEKKYIKLLKKAKIKFFKDEEDLHKEYDNILCDFLINLGYNYLVKEYKKTDKWFG